MNRSRVKHQRLVAAPAWCSVLMNNHGRHHRAQAVAVVAWSRMQKSIPYLKEQGVLMNNHEKHYKYIGQ